MAFPDGAGGHIQLHSENIQIKNTYTVISHLAFIMIHILSLCNIV